MTEPITKSEIEKLEQQIKELTIMVKTMVDNKTYKTPSSQRKASREYYARNKDTLEMKVKIAISNKLRRDRKHLILKQQREKELENSKEIPKQTTQTPFLGY
jgi:predicted lipase